MIQVGITGQSGFIGTYLYNYLQMKKDICCIPFKTSFFEDQPFLDQFTGLCDVIVHMATLHRNPDEQVIINTNLLLTEKLLESCNKTKRCKKIIFTSSIQENSNNAYGISKRESRIKIEDWAKENNNKAITLTLPNVFGPGAKPFHTSFIATFSYQLTHGETPKIIEDREVCLTSVHDLLPYFENALQIEAGIGKIDIPSIKQIRVSLVLEKLKEFHKIISGHSQLISEDYFENLLYKTYCSYLNA